MKVWKERNEKNAVKPTSNKNLNIRTSKPHYFIVPILQLKGL